MESRKRSRKELSSSDEMVINIDNLLQVPTGISEWEMNMLTL